MSFFRPIIYIGYKQTILEVVQCLKRTSLKLCWGYTDIPTDSSRPMVLLYPWIFITIVTIVKKVEKKIGKI